MREAQALPATSQVDDFRLMPLLSMRSTGGTSSEMAEDQAANSSRKKKAMATMFKDVKTLALDLKILGVIVEDDSVYVDFDQKIKSQGRARTSSKPTRMTATVIPQAGGRWVISSILPRG